MGGHLRAVHSAQGATSFRSIVHVWTVPHIRRLLRGISHALAARGAATSCKESPSKSPVRPCPAPRARTLTWLLCWNNCQMLVRKAPLREPPRRPDGSPAGGARPSFTFRAWQLQLWAMGQVDNAPTLASSWVSQLHVNLAPLALICKAVA